MKSARAPRPLTIPSSRRHRGSLGGGAFTLSASGSGRGGISDRSSGSGGSTPPQAAITSPGVTASGSRPRAMRLAEVV